MKIDFKPFILEVDDYHEFGFACDVLKNVVPKIQYEEVGFIRSMYQAIFFVEKDEDYENLKKDIEEEIEDYLRG